MADGLAIAAEAVYVGLDLREVADYPIIDTLVTCPACGHGDAIMGDPAPEGGHFEQCCACGQDFVDSTP